MDNLQFHYFLDNLKKKKKPLDCGFFETFGNEIFDEYYSTLINEYKEKVLIIGKSIKKLKIFTKKKI